MVASILSGKPEFAFVLSAFWPDSSSPASSGPVGVAPEVSWLFSGLLSSPGGAVLLAVALLPGVSYSLTVSIRSSIFKNNMLMKNIAELINPTTSASGGNTYIFSFA